jgi:hypothetical protein
MRNVYWLNPVTGASVESDPETVSDMITRATAPGYRHSVTMGGPGFYTMLWGPPLSGPLHFIWHGRKWAAR